jgi:membrane protease YdiL (CAAX protease family)
MPSHPFESLAYLVLGAAVLVLWLRQFRSDEPESSAFWPGARPTTWTALTWAAAGALVLTLLETGLEIRLGVSSQQTTIPSHFLMAMLGAAVVEEMAFRGFASPADLRGGRLVGVALLGSAVFAWIHGHGLADTKGLVSTGSAFAVSLWFYACRFSPLNPSRSLAPAMVAHAVRNLAVFGIKDAQGFVG